MKIVLFNIFLKLSPSTEILVEFFVTLFGIIFIILIIGYIFYSYNKDKTPPFIKKIIEEEDQEVGDEIKKIEEKFIKALAEDNSKTVNFFINAVRNNYRYLRLKEHYIEREKEFIDEKDNYFVLLRQNKKKILNEGSPQYTDCKSLFNEEILKLYNYLSKYYTELKPDRKPFIESSYNIDLSQNQFFFVKAGDVEVPHFISSTNKNLHFYFYPSLIIKYDKKGQLDITQIQDNKINLNIVEEDNTQIAILSIDSVNFEIITSQVIAAKNFYNTFLAIQNYLIDSEWGFNANSNFESKKEIEIKKILLRLDSLIGLKKIKKDFYDIADYLKIQQLRKFKGLKSLTVNYHCIFMGNPGTGKTSLARILADIYKEMGIVKSGQLIETDRSGLVAEYVGQTAIKTNQIIDKAIGGILFIDEAYSLVSSNDDFGNEAISTLLKRMEDDRDKFIVILAGYNKEMQKFIDSNPGLKSRFTRTFEFEDYSAEELFEIFRKMVNDSDYILSKEAEVNIENQINEAVLNKDINFGNARLIRNIFEKTIQNQATRLSKEQQLSNCNLQTIKEEDIPVIT